MSRIKKNCEIREKEFLVTSHRMNTAKYCSPECRFQGQKNKIGSVKNKCQKCGKEFSSSPSKQRVFCSNRCRADYDMNFHTDNFGSTRRAMLRRGLIEKCERCGYYEEIKILGVHHKDRNRNNNKFENLEVLCPNCHSLEHLKHIPHGFKE